MHFFPVRYVWENLLPALNKAGQEGTFSWIEITFTEFIQFHGILYSMVVRLPERRMYWRTDDDGLFRALCYGDIMSRLRFEDILTFLQSSIDSDDKDEQIICFINAINERLKACITPGDVLVIAESMVKSFP